MCQRMLEPIDELGEELALIEELRRLQMPEATAKRFLGSAGDRLQNAERYIRPDHGSRLEQFLLISRKAVDTGCEDRLHRRRHADTRRRFHQVIDRSFADELGA